MGERADLESVLLADESPGQLTGNTNAAIRTKVKVVDGEGYVIAYNSTNADGVSTQFTWSTPPSTATVNGQALAVASDGTFTDTFKKHEARVYKITL